MKRMCVDIMKYKKVPLPENIFCQILLATKKWFTELAKFDINLSDTLSIYVQSD